ncbi:nickel pincer cofactor biosynthesis protein LarC [Desulfofundulus sp.]|uniref:nickel pincer cofactor biosynthesis protein LarC n=1 Tax=Desulfofundulus sp. TaxID=2282750 RepID=UPI003C773FA1
MNTAYLDCAGGLSGDMLLSALIDAGINYRQFLDLLHLFPLNNFDISISEESRGGWRGARLFFSLPSSPSYRHRNILELLAASKLPATVKNNISRILESLALAEARARGVPAEEVCFEGEQLKSVLAVTGVCVAFSLLQVEEIFCSPLPVGRGPIFRSGSVLPVPTPVTAELMRGVPVYPVDVEGELVTAEGAAIVSTLAAGFGPMPPMRIGCIGYGAGAIHIPFSCPMRVFVGEQLRENTTTVGSGDHVLVLETDIDDMNPEFFSYVDHLLRRCGALDVFLTPTIMKKGRPGTRLTVLCPPGREEELLGVIFKETTTLGVRIRQERRCTLNRHHVRVDTPWGPVGVKIAYLVPDAPLQVSPEYEDCRRLAERTGHPIQEIYHAARQGALLKLHT